MRSMLFNVLDPNWNLMCNSSESNITTMIAIGLRVNGIHAKVVVLRDTNNNDEWNRHILVFAASETVMSFTAGNLEILIYFPK